MPNQIIPVVWEKPLRKSAVNTLDKLNEVIDFINTSDIHEFSFIDGDTGREVVSGTSTQLATLDVFGESVQDGTPTPENPVPVQVVDGYNLLNFQTASQYTVNSDGTITLNATGGFNIKFNALPEGKYWLYARIVSGNASGTVLFTVASISYLPANLGTSVQFIDSIAPNQIWVSDNANFTIGTVIEIMLTAKQCTAFAPYGCIGLQTGDTVTPIDLQGHTLAGLPDGTQDLLRVDSAGVKGIEQYVGIVDLGSLNWLYQSTQDLMYARFYPTSQAPSPNPGANIISEAYITNAYFTNDGLYIRMFGTGYTDAVAFKAAMSGVLLYYQLAEPQHVNLGVMDMPPIPSGSVIKIAASLQPKFDIQWWTESAIPSVINGLKAYVDEQIETVNARIDELHGISRATIVRPDAVIPVLEPIEKITVDETETDVEKEI